MGPTLLGFKAGEVNKMAVALVSVVSIDEDMSKNDNAHLLGDILFAEAASDRGPMFDGLM